MSDVKRELLLPVTLLDQNREDAARAEFSTAPHGLCARSALLTSSAGKSSFNKPGP